MENVTNLEIDNLLFLEQNFMSFSMVNLFSLYMLRKHKQLCFIIP